MNERTRTAIQAEVCRALWALNHNDVDEVQAALFRVLDVLDKTETMERAAIKVEPGQFQILLQVS